jgi:hypothetical protein
LKKSVTINTLKKVEEYGGVFFKGNVYLNGFKETIEIVFPLATSTTITDYQYQCLERINLEWPTIFKDAQEFSKAPKDFYTAKVISVMIIDEKDYNYNPHIEVVLTHTKGILGLPYIYSIIIEDFKVVDIIHI